MKLTFKSEKSKQVQGELAGPRKTSLLSLKKVKSLTLTNNSQLTLNTQELSRCSSQEVLNTSRPKASRRASFNILTRRPSIDALRAPPETPRSPVIHIPSSRSRAATFGSASVRSILREPNTPTTMLQAKNVRFESHQPVISSSTPPEETLLPGSGRSGSINSLTPRFGSSQRRSRRPSVAEIFAPLESPVDTPPQLTEFFQQLDAMRDPLDGLPESLTSTPHKGEDRKTDSSNSSPNVRFGQTVFHAIETSSKRSSDGTSSGFSDITSASSSPSVGRSRSYSDTTFMSPPKASESAPSSAPVPKGSTGPDPFSTHATTYYTPQMMIPATPPHGTSPRRHARRASKEENLIFGLQNQLALKNEMFGQLEADLAARGELVDILGKKLAAAEEEDAKKRKYLRAWKKRVGELEQTCRNLEEEAENSRAESMERSVMDEASSEALRMLHRQISGLERERDGMKKTEVVLRQELGRLETLASEHRSAASRLRRESLTSVEALTAIEQQRDEEIRRHKDVEAAWQVERDGLLAALEQLRAREGEVAALKSHLVDAEEQAGKTTAFLKAAEAGKCALAMERDFQKMQSAKLQEKVVAAEGSCSRSERRVLELEDELQKVRDSQETERDLLTKRIRGEEDRADVVTRKLAASEARVVELDQSGRAVSEVFQRQMEELRRAHSAAMEDALASQRLAFDAQVAEMERLQKDNADKEVRLTALTAALDTKQQELEQPKRRSGVTGVNKATHQRRESSVLSPRVSRPGSLASDSGADPSRERKPSADGSKIPSLSKRPSIVSPTPTKRASMGPPPPPLRSRPSLSATALSSKAHIRSSSATISAVKRKPSTDEKENADTSARRLSRIPTLTQ
ncbi:hypothetical protein FB45DRAFT_1057378 [Roridomyces roridus]|uniref:Uncharacterized protein n=1 Tax=Roridomyces roridus TaxID=1738132 RepID=A0AAD7FQ72_9AGAR|nr:hypothetical protein FB45DRAFT_1057378 [Roridomyces roridus]